MFLGKFSTYRDSTNFGESNVKVVKNEVGRITVFTLLRSVIGQHKTPSLFFFYWDTCGSPVIKRFCFFVAFFFLRHKMEKLRNSTQWSKGGKKDNEAK